MEYVTALGEMLKARRAVLRPDEVGLSTSGRRRVAGLRRDEVAALAGVSEPYLKRLELGRADNPSAQVLDALARALRLDSDATAHLHLLATAPAEPDSDEPEVAWPGVSQLLDAWVDTPAYVRGRTFDVLASNALALALTPMYTPRRNLIRSTFLDPDVRVLFPEWPAIADSAVGGLRAAAGTDRGGRIEALVAELADSSEEFRIRWARHDVHPTRDETKVYNHPVLGRLTLRRHVLPVASSGGQTIIAYQAEPGSRELDGLRALARV